MTQNQFVFKVNLSSVDDAVRPFVPRKAHQKSRSGCAECRRRRIKVCTDSLAIQWSERTRLIASQCDETRPRCGKCSKSGADCLYKSCGGGFLVPLSTEQSYSEKLVQPSSHMYSMSVDLVGADLNDLFGKTADCSLPQVAASNIRALQHFQSVTCHTMGHTPLAEVMETHVGKTAWQHPYLMHMVLAISYAHKKYLQPNQLAPGQRQNYDMAEALHWHKALQQYRLRLSQCSGSSLVPNLDCLVSVTFLIIAYTHALDDDIPIDALIRDDPVTLEHLIDPIAATTGFRALRYGFGFDSFFVWKGVLVASDDDDNTYTKETPGTERLPPAFVDLCGLDENSTSENHPYHKLVRLLTPLLLLKPSMDNCGKLFAYMGRTWPSWQPLIQAKDPRALLLLSWWLVLLRQVNKWWTTTRTKTSCLAIVAYLYTVPEPKVHALLEYPASYGETGYSRIWEPTPLPT